nr:general transcriptional corepressor trfA [Helicoverpa armigera]
MNNWRLLLLAVVAVVQPIASFTDRNLIDGRQQCCDHPSSTPLRDTRSFLRGSYRLSDTTSALRSLSDRDEIRQYRRSTEKRLIEDRERAARQDPSTTARSTRVEYRLERSENSLSRDRLLDVRQREYSARYSRDLKPQEFTRRVVARSYRNSVDRRDATETSRDGSFRNDYRTERFADERLPETRREMQFRSGDRRISLNRDARLTVRTKAEETILEVPDNMNTRQRFTRERSAVRRESSTRSGTERYNLDMDSYRREQRNTDQNTRLDRIRDMRVGLNTREVNREIRRISYLRSDEKFGERRGQNKENSERRESERTQVARRDTRESRILNIENERNTNDRKNVRESRMVNTLNRREVDVRREINVRDEIRENHEQRQSRERILADRRNIRETRDTNTLRDRQLDNRQEIRLSERDSRNTQDERDNRVQVHRRDIREFRLMNNFETRNGRRVDTRREIRSSNLRDTREGNNLNTESRLSREMIEMRNVRDNVESRREIRYDESRFTDRRGEIRQDREQINSRVRSPMDRRTQESRNMNVYVNRRERDTESQREIRNEARVSPDYRLSRERSQIERRNIRESRIVITPHDSDSGSRREIRNNERVSRASREEMRESSDRYSMTREGRELDRRNIRESRMYRVTSRSERRIERDTENRRSDQVRGNLLSRMSRLESRSTDRVTAEDRDNAMLDRRTRSVDRWHFRDVRDETSLSRSVDAERRTEIFRSRTERTNTVENRERESIDSRSRNIKMALASERTNSVVVDKMDTENNFGIANWQYVLYTLQAAYLCALFVQMLKPNHTEKPRKMKLHWLSMSSHYNPIKVD